MAQIKYKYLITFSKDTSSRCGPHFIKEFIGKKVGTLKKEAREYVAEQGGKIISEWHCKINY